MTTPLVAIPLLLVHAASLNPASVPATGKREALLSLDAPAAVHLSAKSASGTWCQLIDRVRGPFAQAGQVGTANCELDLLLDAGQYKIRLESPERGKGAVTLSAQPFVELNASPVRLVPGSGTTTTLRPGQQASFWLSVTSRHVPLIRVAGRHAGDVRLWRNGEWLEPRGPSQGSFSPVPGQPLHEWWLDSVVEPGEYLLVVYGRDSTKVSGSSVDDSLTVEYGFREGPPQRTASFVLPPSGVFAAKVPLESFAGILALESSPASPVSLELHGASRSSGWGSFSTCRVEKNAVVPECSTSLSGSGVTTSSTAEQFAVVLVRGAPGTRGTVEWQPYRSDTSVWSGAGGYYGSPASRLTWEQSLSGGKFLVGLHDLPVDTDSAPLGCQLEKLDEHGNTKAVLARSGPRLGDGEMLDRELNYPGNGALVWFEIAPPQGGGAALLSKVGFGTRKYKLETRGGLKSRCEVFRLESDGSLNRLTTTKPEATACNETLPLTPGWYQLQLYGGLSGVERLVVKEDGAKTATAVPTTAGCLFPDASLKKDDTYRVTTTRTGSVAVRGFILRPLPLDVSEPLHLTLDGKRRLELPLAKGAAVEVRASGAGKFDCSLGSMSVSSRPGGCSVPALAASDTLTLVNPDPTPVVLTLSHPVAPAPTPPPVSYSPKVNPPPRIGTDVPTFFDFDRGESHSATFQVDTPGLYNVTTQGLLSTECTLRTPVVEQVARDAGGGRGRNCLVQTYLQKGRYMLTVQTTGASRGRGAVFLTRRPPREFPGVSGEGDSFFRVDANELVQQRLLVRSPGAYDLSTSGQGGQSFLCRLDDPEGWPIESVPSSCTGRRTLAAGTWLWTQMPLTVESMRRTRLEKVRDEVVLKGNKAHPVDAFTWYRAELGGDGKDELLFSLSGETALDVVLTDGMQGRVFALEADKAPRAVEVIPPQAMAQPEAEQAPEAESDSQGDADEPPSRREYEGEGSEGGEGGESEGGYEPPPPPARAPMQARAAPPPPSGVRITLPAGQYKLVTEHSRGDVNVSYRLHLGSATLLPGMARALPVPSTVPVLIPKDGTLRLRTTGETDVRCRLFDEKMRLVFEGSENGADWNCALAEPITKGKYTLVVESETQVEGQTKVSLALPAVDAKGPLADGAKLSLGAAVVTLTVPVAEKDAVQEVGFTSKTPFSCALEEPTGKVVYRRARGTGCSLLVRPMTDVFKVRLWTTDGSAQVVASLRTKPVVSAGAGQVPPGQALSTAVPRAGRYKTAGQAWCLPSAEKGLLRLCGPEASLEAGATVFATFGAAALSLPLDEVRALASDAPQPLELATRPSLQVVTASAPSVFLLSASVRHGERAAPACLFEGDGTVHEGRDTACFAASKVGTEAGTRLWAASDLSVDAQVTRRAVALPSKAEALTPGRRRLSFQGGVGLFALPGGGRARLELTLPKDGWAVLLDEQGRSVDLCAPTGGLSQCVLSGQGGKVLLSVPSATAEVTTLLLEGAPASTSFTGLYEDLPRLPGTVRLALAAADVERVVSVEGALRCTVALATGARTSDCKATVPPKTAAELVIEHGTRAIRAVAHTPGRDRWARLGLELPLVPGGALPAATAVPLQSGRVDRTLVLSSDALVRVFGDSGVCGLFKGNDLLAVNGLDTGCELVRILTPGTYRLLVRPFAGRPATGTLRWTAEAVSALGEGTGTEEWLAPGGARLFRFETKGKGKVGLGIQSTSEALDCLITNDAYQPIGDGCQQYLTLDKGAYLLLVRNAARPGAVPIAFKPVLLGLSGDKNEIPEDFLKHFFRRAGVTP